MKDFFEENKIDWTTIDEYQKEGTLAGLCMALAESDKLLNYILTNQNYRGENIYEKIRDAKNRFTDLNNLAKALEIKENIFSEYEKEISKEDIKTALKHYRQAITDLVEVDKPDIGLLARMNSWFNYYFVYQPGVFRKIAIWFLAIILSLIILDTTHPGQKLVSFLAGLFFKAANWLIIGGIFFRALVIIVIGTIIYFEKRNK